MPTEPTAEVQADEFELRPGLPADLPSVHEIFLATSAMSLFSWLFTAVMVLYGFCAACKRAVERMTLRHCERRRVKRLRRELAMRDMPVQHLAAAPAAA